MLNIEEKIWLDITIMCHHSVLSRKDEKKCSLKRYWQIPLHKAPCHLMF